MQFPFSNMFRNQFPPCLKTENPATDVAGFVLDSGAGEIILMIIPLPMLQLESKDFALFFMFYSNTLSKLGISIKQKKPSSLSLAF